MRKPYTRTTVDIPTSSYEQLRKRAATENCSMKDLIVRGVEGLLSGNPRTTKRRVKLPIIRSKKPGSIDLDNEKIYQIISFP